MRKYHGMTLIGMLFTMAVIIIIGLLLMRVVPVYLEHYTVLQSIDSLSRLPATEFSSDPSANAIVLKDRLTNQLYVNSIVLPPENIKIVPKGSNGYFQVSIKYQVLKPLVGNANLLFNFDDSKEVIVSAR